MCKRAIVDVNAHETVCGRGKIDRDLRNWLEKDGTLCYTAIGRFHKELSKTPAYQDLLKTWRDGGIALQVLPKELAHAKGILKPHLPGLVSDDSHILELAIASGVEVLVTHDGYLKTDFKTVMGKATGKPKKGFSVYPAKGNPTQRRLFLQRNRCRKADCG